ncbi:MAG: Rid family hydrolase [bacterium]|nr:Rid family hydrolase [bacterium]
MDVFTYHCGNIPVSVNISHFRAPEGVDEYHLVACPTAYDSFAVQLDQVGRAYGGALEWLGLDPRTALLRRFFCSDPANQALLLEADPLANPRATADPCAVSWVGQAPVPEGKVALWAYHANDPGGALDKSLDGATLTWRRGELAHHWTTGLSSVDGRTPYDQTHALFEQYDGWLQGRGLALSDHVIRTWLFVQNIDANYQGMVLARREYFAARGLTPRTHYIASSGIEGNSPTPGARVTLDAYAVGGLRPDQIRYLAALDHLAPTYTYGVTFERATAVSYRDRRQVIISGTASIDPQGNILYPGDVARQLDRTLENIAALLDQAGATLADMALFIVYIRDPGDHAVARRRMRERIGEAPLAVVVAPVCRPGWLIEVEGLAILPAANPILPAF